MSIRLGPLYHWTRKSNRQSIIKDGLKVGQPCSDGTEAWFNYLCFGTTPNSAWGLMPYNPKYDEEGEWDLWEVTVEECDNLYIRGDFSPYIREVRIENSIPPDRIWWVGEREAYSHDSIDNMIKKKTKESKNGTTKLPRTRNKGK